jgi:hypothetical protein
MSGGESFNTTEEFADVDFNEARLEKRFVRTMETLSKQPGRLNMGKQRESGRSQSDLQ